MKFTNIDIQVNNIPQNGEKWLSIENTLFYLYYCGGRVYFSIGGKKKDTDIMETMVINHDDNTINFIYKGYWENCDGTESYKEIPFKVKFNNKKDFTSATRLIFQ